MPRILENEALVLARSIDTAPAEERPWMLDVLTRYKTQQEDEGEPEWPTHARQQEEGEQRFRSMFDDLKNVDKYAPSLAETLQYSENPDSDRARVASIAYLSRAYGKPADEIGSSLDLYRNNYTAKRGQKSVDDLGFYKIAAGEVATMKRKEDTALEGAKAALRGEDVIGSLQAWQAKNLDRMPDSAEFTKGYLKAKDRAGDYLPIADELLRLMESQTGKSNSTQTFDSEAAGRIDEIAGELATMKPRERKQVYASISARAEAAGYAQKGFWAQMLGKLDKGLLRMSQTVPMGADRVGGMIGGFVGGSDVADDRAYSDRAAKARGEMSQTEMEAKRDALGEIHDELASIISGEVDPVKPTISWLNDTIETGLIKGPGAVAPFMAATATLGPWGGGMLFTADFAEQNRRDLRAAGLDNDRAIQIGTIAAPLQAAVESMSNMLQLGKFTKLQTVLAGFTKPIGGGAGLALRYAQNAGVSLASEFTEEQVQDNFIVPAVQQIVGALAADVPEVDWSFYRTRAAESTPELLSVLAPMALVFGGVMTGAQANLSREMTSNIDALKALNYSEAQAVEIIAAEDRVAKASSLWGSRAGDKVTLEEGAKNLSERMRQLSGDVMAQQQELERRGILPRMLRAGEDQWRLTFQDGSTAAFNSHAEADAARWTWTEDQLGKVHALTRQTLASLEKNLDVNREVAVEFSPDVRLATKEELQSQDFQDRIEQGKVLGDVSPDSAFDDAQAIDRATSEADDFLPSIAILGSSVNKFYAANGVEKVIQRREAIDDVLRTTIKLWEGSHVLTLVEEKLEGDAKVIIADVKGREWMLSRLRSYAAESGDKLFTTDDDEKITNKMLVEAWSHLGQSYLVGRSTFGEPLQKNAMRRFGRLLMRSGFTGAMNSEAAFFAAVASRASKLVELKKSGKLSDDLVSELEKQLGIDSQEKHERGAETEARSIIDTSGYSEETPGPNGETFSISRAVPADTSKVVQMPDGEAEEVREDIKNIQYYHGSRQRFEDIDPAKDKLRTGNSFFGVGSYWTGSRDDAAIYGPYILRRKGLLKKPLIISDKSEHLGVTFEAYDPEVDPFIGATISPGQWTQTAINQGYDGVLRVTSLERLKRLRIYLGPEMMAKPSSFSKVEEGLVVEAVKFYPVNPESSRAADGTFSTSRATPVETFSIGSGDAEYMAAVEAGDMEKAQRMVDGAAKAAGYDVGPVWHGGTDQEFTTFDPAKLQSATSARTASLGFFFSTDKHVSQRFTGFEKNDKMENVRAPRRFYLKSPKPITVFESELQKKRGGTTTNIREAVKVAWDGQPSDTGNPVILRDAFDVFWDAMRGVFNKAKEEITAADLRAYAKARSDAGMTGIIFKNTNMDSQGDVSDQIVVFDPSQIKSADPITRDADGNVIPLAQRFNPADDRITYSIGAGNFASRMAAAFSPFQANPELRLAIAQVAKERALRLGAEWIAKGDVIRSAKDISKEQAFREADGFDRRMNAYLDGLAPSARQELEFEPATLESDPLVAAMLDFGKLMSQSTAKKSGKVEAKAGDYDGAPWLPPAWYSKGAGIMPDQMAQAMFDAGLLPDAYTDTLWAALASRIESTRKDKAAHREAVEAYQDAKKAAKADARLEAEAWANQTKKTAGSAKAQREMLKAALRTLDGILAAAPPVVRARVGGYVKMAGLATDEAMLAEIEKRIDKLNVELEKWLKKEYNANIKKKLEKFGSDRGKRGVMEGRTIASVTERIDYADDFSQLSKAAQDVQIDHLEAVISDTLSKPEQVDIAITKLGIAESFYDFENQDAEALSAVSDWVDEVTSAGRDIRKALDDDRREYLAALRTDGITSILGIPNSSQIDASNRQENIKSSLLKQMLERVKGFINSVLPTTVQQLEDVFGVDSEVTNEFAPRIWAAANRSTDIKAGVEKQRRAMLANVFKTKSTIKQIAALSKLQQSKMSGVFITEGRKTETVTVPVDILERLADGSMTAKAAGLSQVEVDEALAQWAGASTRTKNATIERETFAGTQKELQMSEMQALNYLLHWNQEAVKARMENHGWTQASIDQLNAFMSDETKAIGRWMSETYATAGRSLVDPVYRRIFHAPLPLVRNFAPTYYETPGNDSTMAIDAQQNTSGIMASFTKARRPHNYNVRQVDAMTAFLSHFEHVSHWVSFVELLRDMKAVLTSVEVQNAVITHHGPAAAAALTRRINDTANQGNDQAWSLHEVSHWFNRINQARAFKSLAWKISPPVKQTSAFLNPLLADVPAHAYTLGLSKLMAGNLDVSAMWKSDNIQRRVEGGFSAEARIAMQAAGNGPVGAVAIKLMQNGMLGMQWTDAGWNAAGAAIAWDYYRGLAVESGEPVAMAERSATRAVERMLATAAQPADLVNRSLVEGSSNPLVKGAWMFSSESRKNLAIEFYAAKRLLTGKSKNKAMDAQRVIVAHVIMAMTTQLMSGLLALALGDDDDKEREWSAGEWAAAILAGPINGLFVFGDGLRYLSRMALGLRAFRSLPPYGQMVEDAVAAGSHIDDIFNGDDEEVMKEINRLSGSTGFVLSAFFGPAAQAADVVLGNPLRELAKALDE